MAEPILIRGLNEFVRNLRTLDSALPKVLRTAFNAVGETVVAEARGGVPRKSGRAAGSVRAKSTQRAFIIAGGSKRVPYYPWLDFGGTIEPRRGQLIKRPFLKEGRYIYASYFKHRDELATGLETALIDAARSAGVEVD